MEMAKLAVFNGEAGKVMGFITAYRSYLKIKMREGIWRRRGGGNKGGRVETIRVRRKIDGGVCSNIQKSSKGERI